jgi:hypothetical protein
MPRPMNESYGATFETEDLRTGNSGASIRSIVIFLMFTVRKPGSLLSWMAVATIMLDQNYTMRRELDFWRVKAFSSCDFGIIKSAKTSKLFFMPFGSRWRNVPQIPHL